MVHRAQHVAEGIRVARHFHADVEALDHAELLHRVVDGLLRYIDCSSGPHFPCEIQAVVVHVGDHDVTGPGVTRDGDRHDADRPGACDEDVFTDEIEGEGCVGRIAKRVENGCHVVRDGVR